MRDKKFIVGFVAFVLVVVGAIGFGISYALNTSTQTACVVEDKDRTRSEGGSDMRVYTENCGVLMVSDNWLKFHFDSADVFNEIEVGKTYDFETFGYRIPVLSQFESIISATEVK